MRDSLIDNNRCVQHQDYADHLADITTAHQSDHSPEFLQALELAFHELLQDVIAGMELEELQARALGIELNVLDKPTVSFNRVIESVPALRSKMLRQKVEAMIAEHAPYAGLLTINFDWSYGDKFLLKSLNAMLKRLNESIFGKKAYRRGEACLNGYCFAEVCYDSDRITGNLHFHLLLLPGVTRSGERFDSDSIAGILQPLLAKVVDQLVDNTKQKRKITNMRSVDVTPYTGLGKLANYLTKEFKHRGAEAYEFWGVLGFHGVTGLNIPANRKCRDEALGRFH